MNRPHPPKDQPVIVPDSKVDGIQNVIFHYQSEAFKQGAQ